MNTLAINNEVFGLPTITVDFKTQAGTAIARSSRGVGAMILHDVNIDVDEFQYFSISEASDIPTTLEAKNADLIEKALLGNPLTIHVYAIPPKEKTITTVDASGTSTTSTVQATMTQADVLKELADVKFNYICAPTSSNIDQEALSTWVINQRSKRNKSFKAIVANVAADNEGVINFTTNKIRVENPAYQQALSDADGDASRVSPSIARYNTYTAKEYTARIMGAAAGIGLDRSMTYYTLSEVYDCEKYDDIDTHINQGELCLFDERDGNGVKIARACNSLTSFTATKGEDFRFIKIIEGLDLIHDDIVTTFRNDYVGKINNTYNNKMLFVAAILVYFNGLKGTVLDDSATANNTIGIDIDAHRSYMQARGVAVDELNEQQILEFNTGTHVYLSGNLSLVNAAEDLQIHFVL